VMDGNVFPFVVSLSNPERKVDDHAKSRHPGENRGPGEL